MDNRSLAIDLVKAETEDEIIKVLTRYRLWDDFALWKAFGDNENNVSTIGNQQSKPDAAFTEKVINAVDAVLMKECLVRGIPITSAAAPQSMKDAMEIFLGVKNGQLSNIDSKKRTELSQNIIVASTGQMRGEMNLYIVDRGEGQSPDSLPKTILSISRSNKLRVPFVQGKFNMGGTGVLPFCGEHRFQLIISRRCPLCAINGDSTADKWSVTIVRREEAREGRRSTMYTYLTAKDRSILCFESSPLPIIPSTNPRGSYENLEYGTLFKLYNYAIPGYKSNLILDFNYRLSMLMPSLAHPVRLRECRPGYSGHSLESTLSGLETRLADDRQSNIEVGFPDSHQFNVSNQSFSCAIYLFLHGKSENYREKDGILYVVNGQTHASAPDSFFNRANLSYLCSDLLVIVDCSNLDISHREDLFMNSRDRLRSGDLSKAIEERILEILKEHEGLKRLQNERRSAAIRDRIGEDRPLEDVLQKILDKSPVLSKILLTGSKLSSPFNMRDDAGTGITFVGKSHPTFFRRIGNGVVTRPINHSFRVQFETNAENNYFSRGEDPGKLIVIENNNVQNSLIRHLGLFNGIATLTLDMPDNAKPGLTYKFYIYIDDVCLPKSRNFETSLDLAVVEDPVSTREGSKGVRLPPTNSNEKGNRARPITFSTPNIFEVQSAEWGKYDMSEITAMSVKLTDDNCDFFINIDNIHLLTELKTMRDVVKIDLTKSRYKYSMVLIGMATMSYYKNLKGPDDVEYDIPQEVNKVTTMLSPVLVPMLDSMSDLAIDIDQGISS